MGMGRGGTSDGTAPAAAQRHTKKVGNDMEFPYSFFSTLSRRSGGGNLSLLVDTASTPDRTLPAFRFPEDAREGTIRGFSLGGIWVRSPEIQGVTLAGLLNNSNHLTGFAAGAVNLAWKEQRGVSVGVFNYAENLGGFEIGLLNYVAANPPLLRLLPLVNFKFP